MAGVGFRAAIVGSLILGIVLGCKSRPKPTDPPKGLVAQRWVEPSVPEGAYIDTDRAMSEGLAVALSGQPLPPPTPHRPLNVLALSAGGKFGAYTSGVLAGWTASGTRPPEFDVVTGASSGAIIAVFAFLGPQYDEKLHQLFLTTKSKDMFKVRPLRYLPTIGSFASPKPLKELIDREMNQCVLDEIRAAHQAGRRHFIATLGVQSKRVTTWDIGAIACCGRPDADDLVRKVILAACSIPGMVPPVDFDVVVNGCHYKEKHSDGGAVTQVFVKLAEHQATPVPGTPWLAGSTLYVLAAGKLYSDPTEANLSLFGRVGNTVSSSLYALYRAELCKLYALCLSSGMCYNTIALDPDVQVKSAKSMSIDPDDMLTLWTAGYKQACGGVPWRKMPPGGLCGEEDTPRQGTCFVTIPQP